jgi:hypothetical protein
MFGDLQAGTIVPVSDLERARAFAWFTDPDGNIFSIFEPAWTRLRPRAPPALSRTCGLDVRGAEE